MSLSVQQETVILQDYVSEHKQALIEQVLNQRTRHLTLVLEDIFQPHNANATLRTAECLGLQDIHLIENRNRFDFSPGVTQGSSKWLSLKRWNTNVQDEVDLHTPENFPTHNTQACLNDLRQQGYQIVATTPGKQSVTLQELDLSQPTALLFGTEAKGLTTYALNQADAYLRLPMAGFTESYNISVSVAITLSRLRERLQQENLAWQLSDEEKDQLRLEWYKKCVKKADEIIARKAPYVSAP